MSSNPSSLYSVPRLTKKAPLPTSANLTFTSTLSTLLASASTEPQSKPRPRPTSSKTDIFSTHNKGTKKRALADVSHPSEQKHAGSSQAVDTRTLHRSKRKMDQKARLYDAMKRGEYVPTEGRMDKEAEGLVDFDRKWAEGGEGGDSAASSTDEEENNNHRASAEEEEEEEGAEEMVEYVDEFGRQRLTTKTAYAKLQKQKIAATHATASLASFSARPSRPENLIQGDTIQTSAFNPSAPATLLMETLARKRDRSLTPPEETHYDASTEVRSKGVGFYQFSKDAEGRKREMEALEREREGTERGRREGGRGEERKRRVQERRRVVGEVRGRKLAERFLGGLELG